MTDAVKIQPKIHLAPMEGVVDFHMRRMMTEIGGYDQCVTEFLRVTNNIYPDRVFQANCPELLNNSETDAGIPTFLQLLGGNPEMLAKNAIRAAALGACGIDLNFGCPAKTVNKHDGGASLLQYPHRVYDIVSAVREAVPDEIPVSAKIRLGFADKELALENAKAVEEAGAYRLTIHARTKMEGYKPPAHWEWIGKIREHVDLPLIANGEIWTIDDFHRCRELSGVNDVMIGRGAISQPDLANLIKLSCKAEAGEPMDWPELLVLIQRFFSMSLNDTKKETYAVSRLKQWTKQLARNYPEADACFTAFRKYRTADEVRQVIFQPASSFGNQ
ncbi:MAG: tRNA-dihydrouridine synthase C [Gammaproteobacteria bacterium]|jgi:tRNA-dihydrouridine synthase C